MNWQRHFNRARRSIGPVAVHKQQVGSIPPGFQAKGVTIDGLWGVYEGQRGGQRIRITELLGKYLVSVSTRSNRLNQLSDVSQEPVGQPVRPSVDGSDNIGKALAGLLAIGVGATALGKAFSGPSEKQIPDPSKAHRVFISHSWAHEDHYEEVKSLLDDTYGFEYFDHSVSSDDPIDAQLPNHLRKRIRDQMRSASVVLVLAGMYVSHSQWIKEEIEIAVEMGKPIIGVVPAENERVPTPVRENATKLVESDGQAILDAIREHA